MILIAGAGPGMGRAMALLFAQKGAKVGVIAHDPSKGEVFIKLHRSLEYG